MREMEINYAMQINYFSRIKIGLSHDSFYNYIHSNLIPMFVNHVHLYNLSVWFNFAFVFIIKYITPSSNTIAAIKCTTNYPYFRIKLYWC